MRHVVDAVKRAHKVDAVVSGEWLDLWVGESCVGEARGTETFVGTGQGVLRNVVAHEGAVGKLGGHAQHRPTSTRADISNRGASTQRVDYTNCGQHERDEVGIVPRLETSFNTDGAVGAVTVVVVPDARAK